VKQQLFAGLTAAILATSILSYGSAQKTFTVEMKNIKEKVWVPLRSFRQAVGSESGLI
jgi:hypothetical protein